jgi:hypothetical protein
MISSPDRIKLAALITAHPRTVARVYAGRGSDFSRARVVEGAKALGLPLPPDPSSPSSPEPSPTNSNRAA